VGEGGGDGIPYITEVLSFIEMNTLICGQKNPRKELTGD
jgi:hypothetical protein